MNKYRVTSFHWNGGEIGERVAEHVDVEAREFQVHAYTDGPTVQFYDSNNKLIAAITNFHSVTKVTE
jgi:hypothetical protein